MLLDSVSTPPTATSVPPGFAALGLHEALVRAAQAAGHHTPTPIQMQAVPSALDGRDVLGCARTGTGKTAAFVLPILHHLLTTGDDRSNRVRALVLAPTRELAAQIGEVVTLYGGRTGIRHAVIFGGVSQRPQERALRDGVDILVATPGRLLDLLEQGAAHVDAIDMLVLDEFDRMLDQGFLPAVRRVLRHVPRKRQTLLFSATTPPEQESIVKQIVHAPVRVAVSTASSTPDAIAQSVWFVDGPDKRKVLAELLRDDAIGRSLVFTRTKHGANRVAKHLLAAGVEADAIHGNKSQNARERSLGRFKTGELRVLVATDIAARGIDVDDVSHVINFDLPADPDTYVHRIGRTARAGRSGTAVSLCAQSERSVLRRIEKRIGTELRAENEAPPDDAPPASTPPPRRGVDRRRRRRR